MSKLENLFESLPASVLKNLLGCIVVAGDLPRSIKFDTQRFDAILDEHVLHLSNEDRQKIYEIAQDQALFEALYCRDQQNEGAS